MSNKTEKSIKNLHLDVWNPWSKKQVGNSCHVVYAIKSNDLLSILMKVWFSSGAAHETCLRIEILT